MSKKPSAADSQRAVAYVRLSPRDADAPRLGVDAQKADIAAWASRHGVTIASWRQDIDVSGGTSAEDRPGLVAALADLRAHGAGLLLIAKRDRLARDSYVAGAIERAVAKCGARIASADGTPNGDTPADKLFRTLLDGVAEFERGMIRMRTKAALAAKRAKGEPVGAAPFGFRELDGRVVPDPREQTVIQIVSDMQHYPVPAIVRMLSEAGFVNRAGHQYHRVQIHRILRSLTQKAA